MAMIGKVAAVFTSDTSGLASGAKSAGASLGALEKSVGSMSRQLSVLTAIQVGKVFANIASSAVNAARSLVDMGAASAETIDRTSKLAQSLGTTYTEMAGLSLAAELAGQDMEVVAKGMTRAAVAIDEARQGTGRYVDAFGRLGIAVDDFEGKSPAQQFELISDAIAGIEDPTERAALAVQIFGRSGAELVPLFNAGSGAIAQAREEAERFGTALTNEQASNVEAMNDAFTRAQTAIEGVIQQVVAYLAPAIEEVTNTFTTLIGDIGGANIGNTIGRAIIDAAVELAKFADKFIPSMQDVFSYLSDVGGQWNSVMEFGQRVFSGFAGIIDSLQVAFGGITLGLTKAVERVLEGAKALVDWTGMSWPALDSSVEALSAFNETLGDKIGEKAQSAGENFNYAVFGDTTQAEKAGEALAGPWESMLTGAIDRSENAIEAVDEVTSRPFRVEEHVEVEVAVKEAVKGVDSRSREGIAEMFRLMRTQRDPAQEEQIRLLEQVEQNTRPGFDEGADVVFAIPQGAGG